MLLQVDRFCKALSNPYVHKNPTHSESGPTDPHFETEGTKSQSASESAMQPVGQGTQPPGNSTAQQRQYKPHV